MKKAQFDALVASVREAGSLYRSTVNGRGSAGRMDVQAIRNATGLSQSEFALLIGVSVKTLQNWEQGRRDPQGPARALLTVFRNDPRAAVQALHR